MGSNLIQNLNLLSHLVKLA